MVSDLIFAHQFQFFYGVFGNHSDHIGITSKTCTLYLQIVCNDHVSIFLGELAAGIFQHILGFH